MELDEQVRLEAFRHLRLLMARRSDTLVTWNDLSLGFTFQGQRVPFVGPQGIFKPKVMKLPLTIATAPPKPGKEKPYDDGLIDDTYLAYCYRGKDPQHPDNAGLRQLMERSIPLIYLHGIVPGLYAPQFPVYIVGDDPRTLRFRVDLEGHTVGLQPTVVSDSAVPQRRYGTALVLRRLHQAQFRERVLLAYREHCAICRLRHRELLDAAHILPDQHSESNPTVDNGLALCKLHHAAFDANILGIRPDYFVEIRHDVLAEIDGPMLLHGLQGFQGAKLVLPKSDRDRPRQDFLEERYELFRRSA
jgi:putative restriction endonuclease